MTMFTLEPSSILAKGMLFFHGLPVEGSLVFMGLLAYVLCILLFKGFGSMGLVLFQTIALIVANTQSVKAYQLPFLKDPVAMGTIIFTSIFFATDLLSEFYDKKTAQRGIHMSLAGYTTFAILMLATLYVPPAKVDRFQNAHQAMVTLFLPAPAILLASIMSYWVSQFNDVWIFRSLRRLTQGRHLWLRTLASTFIAGFIDSILFSVLAWKVFAPIPVSWHTLWHTYILGTYMLRILLSFVQVPLMYVVRALQKKRTNASYDTSS